MSLQQITEDYGNGREAAMAAWHILELNVPNMRKLLEDAYVLGYVDGRRAERSALTVTGKP